MNNDLISREALREHKFLTPQVKVIGGRRCGKTREQIIEAYQQGWNDAIDAIIDNAPTVEPDKIQAIMSDYLVYRCEPQRPQGEWNYIQAGMCVCPFCGAMPHKLYKNYCAKCGAELKGGAE